MLRRKFVVLGIYDTIFRVDQLMHSQNHETRHVDCVINLCDCRKVISDKIPLLHIVAYYEQIYVSINDMDFIIKFLEAENYIRGGYRNILIITRR